MLDGLPVQFSPAGGNWVPIVSSSQPLHGLASVRGERGPDRIGLDPEQSPEPSAASRRARICKEGNRPMCHPDAPAIGIDVCKHHLDAHLLPHGEQRRFNNNPQGIEQLIAFVQDASPARIVVESTGGYERQVLYTALAKGLPVAMVNPRPVRDFAKALGLLAKTDAIDAKVLARFAQQVPTRLTVLPSEQQQTLKELVTRRRQLVDQSIACRNNAST